MALYIDSIYGAIHAFRVQQTLSSIGTDYNFIGRIHEVVMGV